MTVAGRVESAATTLLAFARGSRRPVLAVKVHRGLDAGGRMRAEVALLEDLAGITDVAAWVPRVIFAGQLADRWVLVQTALEGTPMSGTRGPREIGFAFDWLERLHHARPRAEGQRLRSDLERAIDALRTTFDLSPRELEYVSSIEIERALAQGAFLEHGDFAPHNILVGSSGVGVIDWTDGRLAGVALHDAFFFATTANVLRASTDGTYAGILRAFARAFLDAGPERDRAVAPLQRHAAAVGVDPGAMDALFAIFLIRVAVAEAGRLRAAHERGSWSSFALHVAAGEELGPERVVEAQPWIGFLRVVAARGGTSFR